MYRIKQKAEDFFVKEIPSIKLKERGPYVYFWLRKKNLTTPTAIKRIALKLRIKEKRLGYAGLKDRRAVTEQLCSALRIEPKRLLSAQTNTIKIKIAGTGKEPICLGSHAGNFFRIVVRNLSKKEALGIANISGKIFIPNLFGEQRFSRNNAKIGKLLVKKRFKEAIEMLSKDAVLKENIAEQLKKNPKDYIGVLRRIPKNILRFYVHAYQSSLFNRIASKLLHKKRNIRIKLPGYDFKCTTPQDKLMAALLKKESVKPRDFIIKQLPNISSCGTVRNLFVKLSRFKAEGPFRDELNKGKYKLILSFRLPKASYATTAIKALFNQEYLLFP